MVFPLAHELSCECCLLLGGVVRRASKVGVLSPFPLFPLPATMSHPVGHRGEAAPLLHSLSKTLGAVPATAKQVWTMAFFFFLYQIFQSQKLLVNRKENFHRMESVTGKKKKDFC